MIRRRKQRNIDYKDDAKAIHTYINPGRVRVPGAPCLRDTLHLYDDTSGHFLWRPQDACLFFYICIEREKRERERERERETDEDR